MKRTIIALLIVFLCFLGCAKKEVINGIVNQPLHLSAFLESTLDTTGATYQWTFVSKPFESKLDILSFQPDSRLFNVYFIPDVEGEYVVQYTLYGQDGEIKDSREYTCAVVMPEPGAVEVSAPPETYAEEDTLAGDEGSLLKPQYLDSETVEAEPAPEIYKPPQAPPPPTVKPKPAAQVVKGKNVPKVTGKYTIQISSWKKYETAEKALHNLENLGLDVYIQRTFFKETNEYWYRIRSGTFNNYQEAVAALKELKITIPNEKLWIDSVREEL